MFTRFRNACQNAHSNFQTFATPLARKCARWAFVGTWAYLIYTKGGKEEQFVCDDALTVLIATTGGFLLGSSGSDMTFCASFVHAICVNSALYGAAAGVLAVGYEVVGRLR